MTEDRVSGVASLKIRDLQTSVTIIVTTLDLLVHIRIESWIIVNIRHIDGLASLGDIASDPLSHWDPSE